MQADPRARPEGLLVDFGGVLTSPVTWSFRAFAIAAGLEKDLVKRTIVEAYGDPDHDGPVQRLEKGEIDEAEFEAALAALLTSKSGVQVGAEGLVERMFAQVESDEDMLSGVAALRRAGVRTALLSNSWGSKGQGAIYPRERFGELFDVVVLSGDVGLRKPDPRIFQLAVERLELEPQACVFVDDLQANVDVAESLGITSIAHRSAEETLTRLVELFRLDPSALTGP